MKRRTLLQSLAMGSLRAASDDGAWLGPEYWANPLQDWRRRNGRMECHVAGGDRNVYWLTKELGESGDFTMSVRLGRIEGGRGWVGFRVGVKGLFQDYRDAAVRGVGLEAGITSDGRLFIGDPSGGPVVSLDDTTLTLRLAGGTLELSTGSVRITREAPAEWVTGGVALVCSNGAVTRTPVAIQAPPHATVPKPGTQRGGTLRCWFSDWKLSGARVREHPERAWGPLLFNQYTLSRGAMKMTVQLAPLEGDLPPVELQANGKTIATASVDAFSATARFRIPNWNDKRDTPYTVRFRGNSLTGVIRHDPMEKERIVAGALTCQNDFGFPHAEMNRNLRHLNPDILLFTGDQIYERNGEYGIQREPLAVARLDYLRKWFLFGWAWGDLTRDIPCVCLPDDHDVYHGNVWGAGGRRAEYPDGDKTKQAQGQDSGGYTMPAEWVNMVQRTQASHLPDGPRARVDQNLTTHFSHLVWGGVSFALLEDRKFKSAPKQFCPDAKILNGWPQNPAWDSAKQGDMPGASLLGEDQEKFLAEWAKDWSGGIWMKAVVSETIFANVATLPRASMNDGVVPGMPLIPLDGYAPDDKLAQDHDSNSWPQTPRNRALRLIRSGLAVHIAGDQHLASTVQYGIDAHNDGPYAICTPAISNLFPRRWFPPKEGANRKPGAARFCGEHVDGFGNRISVHAVANPRPSGVFPAALHDRAVGFGVVEFEKKTRKITLTNWPRWTNFSKPGAKPYDGWPIVIHQWDNGFSASRYKLVLPRAVQGVVQVIHQPSGELLYAVRLDAPTRALPVLVKGEYSVKNERGELRGLNAV